MTGAAGAAAQAAGKATWFDWAMLLFGAVSITLLIRELRAIRVADEAGPPAAEEA